MPENKFKKPEEYVPEEAKNTSVPLEFLTELLVSFNKSQNELIKLQAEALKNVIVEARKAPIDPIKEAQKERAKLAKENAETAFWQSQRNRAANCPSNHLREDMTSAIAWAQQSDGKVRGTCQHCNTVFSPVREECVSQEVFESYKDLRKIPTQRGTGVIYIS